MGPRVGGVFQGLRFGQVDGGGAQVGEGAFDQDAAVFVVVEEVVPKLVLAQHPRVAHHDNGVLGSGKGTRYDTILLHTKMRKLGNRKLVH